MCVRGIRHCKTTDSVLTVGRLCLKAKSKEQKQTWCQEIKKLMIESCDRCIPDHAKQLVLGTKNSDDRLAGNRNKTKTVSEESSK